MRIYTVIELNSNNEINSIIHTTKEQEAIDLFEQIISEVSDEEGNCYWVDLRKLNKVVMRHWINTQDKFSCILTRKDMQ